jgi:hypothetical protein
MKIFSVRSRNFEVDFSPPPTEVKEMVMAKVIEFYIPKNFRKPLRTVAQPQLGKVIEFCAQTKRSA